MTLAEALAMVREAGYLVAEVPPCDRADWQHGRHPLITRTASCPGSTVLPHGYVVSYLGLLGMWVSCRCGGSFSDYAFNDYGEPSRWDAHQSEHGLTQEKK